MGTWEEVREYEKDTRDSLSETELGGYGDGGIVVDSGEEPCLI